MQALHCRPKLQQKLVTIHTPFFRQKTGSVQFDAEFTSSHLQLSALHCFSMTCPVGITKELQTRKRIATSNLRIGWKKHDHRASAPSTKQARAIQSSGINLVYGTSSQWDRPLTNQGYASSESASSPPTKERSKKDRPLTSHMYPCTWKKKHA